MSPWQDRPLKLAVAVWAALVVGVCLRPLLQPGRSDFGLLWHDTGRAWLLDMSPYRTGNEFESFRYSPLIAGLCVPLGLLPEQAAGVLWRLISAAVLLGGLREWLRWAVPAAFDADQTGWLLLLLAPLSLGSLNNGQANTVLAGLLLLAVAAVAQRRWNRAALWLALASWLKVYPLALALLLVALYPRRLAWRFAAAVALLGAAPFLVQAPGYVAGQYAVWFDILRTTDSHRRFLEVEKAYRDLLLLLRLWRIPITAAGFAALQMAGGAACGWLCLAGRRRGLSERRLLLRALVVCVGWMMLLGPATESNTYMLLAPVAAWVAVWAHAQGPAAARYLAGQAVGLLLLCVLACAVPAGRVLYHSAGLQPIAALLLLGAFFLAERAASEAGPRGREFRLWREDSPAAATGDGEMANLDRSRLLGRSS
ncbi:MAG: glycosyltransferase 87 family protein [Gemmataceae bacterium]